MIRLIKKIAIVLFLGLFRIQGIAQNPLPQVKAGMTDPHIHVYDGVAYLTVGHDSSIYNKHFNMDYWAMYSSRDLVNWKTEYTLRPEETFIGKPDKACWATDFIKKDGRFYWYISQHNLAIGVMTAQSPGGPWTDPLGKPMIKQGTVPTDPYDPAVVEYNGNYYIIFGVWNYYIARLNNDMISLAEEPRKIIINNPRGPYNLDGKNKESPTDDKPFVHIYNGKFYLSWGCFYAMSDNMYGPYEYKDAILNDSSFAAGYKEPTWPKGFRQGRHGSFFQMNHQWYFSYCDISQTGNRFFRSSFISYVHYKENGEMAPIRVDGIGVGQYDAGQGPIEAEDYFNASKMDIQENAAGGFVIANINNGGFVTFPNIKGLAKKTKISFRAKTFADVKIEVHQGSPDGQILTTYKLNKTSDKITSGDYVFDFNVKKDIASLCFVFKGNKENLLLFDSFHFK
jgi:arabinoxylan arabinofuranohydrolase